MPMIPILDPGRRYRAHKADYDAAIARVLESGRYILGAEVAAFEEEFSASISGGTGEIGGTRVGRGSRKTKAAAYDAVAVGNGTDALKIALRAAGVKPGDEVITVSFTSIATVAAIVETGARPQLVDVTPDTLTLDPAGFESSITPKTRAVVPVHLYGHPAAMDAIVKIARSHGIRVIEDCAHAQGATYHGVPVGRLGDAGAFSFHPTKNLGAFGDGGLVLGNAPGIADDCRRLREYGWNEERISAVHGVNSRLDELQAAVLRVGLTVLAGELAERRRLADAYNEAFAKTDLTLPARGKDSEHAFHLYVVRHPRRDALIEHLRSRGVGVAVHYPMPVHIHYAYRGLSAYMLSETAKAANEVVSLPLYPGLTDSEQERVIEAVVTFRS